MKIKSKSIPKLAAISFLILSGVFASWQMIRLPLWGWWPLLMLLSFWMAIILIVYPKDPTERKWMGASTLSGVLLGLGFPPSPLTWVVMVAWIPLLAVENGIYQRRDAVRPGKVFFYAFHSFVLWNIIATFWVTNTAFVAGIIANFLNASLMATAFVIFHVLRHRFTQSWAWLVFISTWISFEYIHHFWDFSWPWLTLGNALSQYPWAVQWYEYTGVFGGSIWLLLLNYAGYNLIVRWMRANNTRWWLFATLLLIPIGASLWIWRTVEESKEPPVSITVVQPNFEPHYEKFDIPQREQLSTFLKLSFAHTDSTTQYLVFPETSFEGVRLNTFMDNPAIRLFQNFVDSFPDLRLITGISSFRILNADERLDVAFRTHVSREGDTTYWDIQNSAVQLTSGQEEYQLYFKSKLVPGPEMFPFKEFLFFFQPIVDKLGGSFEGHTRQQERSVFTGGALSVAPIICYESIYGDYTGGYVRKGATALFIVTNDGWWDLTPGHVQHLKLGTLRAIEHRRPIARSANTGISAFIDIKGRIHQPTRYRETTAVKGYVTPETRMTFYTHWGDIVAKVCVLMFLGFVLWALFALGMKKVKPVRP